MAKLELWYPVRPYSIAQAFGDNQACVKDFGLPTQQVTGKINGVCPVGTDELYPHFGMRGHNGIDLISGEQVVYASCAGVVVEKQEVPARGLGLGILTDDPVDLGIFGTHYVKVRYWHLKSFNVEVGDRVEIGDRLGITDNTGYSSAAHLHFEVQMMDKDAGGHPVVAYHPDSIFGTIDPVPFLVGFYADEKTKVLGLYGALILALQKLVELLKQK